MWGAVEPADSAETEVPASIETHVVPEVSATIEPAAQGAPEVRAKFKPEAHVARAQARPIKKKRVISSMEELFQQKPPWLLDEESFVRYLFFGRVN
jgi:uncharacterized membrane protein